MISRDEVTKLAQEGWKARRPILHHLTEDHCWLLSIPLPDSRNKPWFHLMIDSWLLGPALQVPVLWTSLFTTEHLNEPAVKGYDDVVDLCRMIDQAVVTDSTTSRSSLDAVLITHFRPDHFSPRTLLEFPKDIPVLTSAAAVSTVQGLKHFDNITTLPTFAGKVEEISVPALPKGMGMGFITGDYNIDHIAAVITLNSDLLAIDPVTSHPSPEAPGSSSEVIILTLHGSGQDQLASVIGRSDLKPLVMLWSTTETISFGGKPLSRGTTDGVEMARRLRPKWWIASHNEITNNYGLFSYWINMRRVSMEEALEVDAKEAEAKGIESKGLDGVEFREIEQGRGMILV